MGADGIVIATDNPGQYRWPVVPLQQDEYSRGPSQRRCYCYGDGLAESCSQPLFRAFQCHYHCPRENGCLRLAQHTRSSAETYSCASDLALSCRRADSICCADGCCGLYRPFRLCSVLSQTLRGKQGQSEFARKWHIPRTGWLRRMELPGFQLFRVQYPGYESAYQCFLRGRCKCRQRSCCPGRGYGETVRDQLHYSHQSSNYQVICFR